MTVPEAADSWGNILLSLLFRWLAVFVVLGALQIGLNVSGAIVSRLVRPRHRGSQGH